LNDRISTAAPPQKRPEVRAARPSVGLFVTCLVDLFRPSVGMAAVQLLEAAGCEVAVPGVQVCCGQPAYNSGDGASTREIAKQVITAFESFDYTVGPSGSCMATIIKEYPKLFEDDAAWKARAVALSGRTYELLSFLSDVRHFAPEGVSLKGDATYHDSCSGLRSLGIKQQPRRLLSAIEGLTVREMQDAETCCGFGGTFCVKYPAVSVKMADDKIANASETGAGYLFGGDLGCLLNIAGRMSREGRQTKVYHTAEVLAGMTDAPAIGKPAQT
jgi:L-lactate dehydrogenase complex protein LldE